MFSNEMQIMLYVDDVAASVEFWKTLGFFVVEIVEADGTIIAEVAPKEDAQVHFVLYDRNFIAEHSPEVAMNAPSIMFFSDDIVALYKKMDQLDVQLGELIQMEERMVFNFEDNDGNYFAVSGK